MVRPKRRRHRDNIYLLDYNEMHNTYNISFHDNQNQLMHVEVAEEVYKIMDKFELDDISELNEFDRHIEHLELSENELFRRVSNKQVPLGECVITQTMVEVVKKTMKQLPEIQRRRVALYYFEEMTFEEIAILEGCTKMAVKCSVDIALKKLKEILEK